MRVLVTGANGFVGARVAAALAAQGHDVRAMLRPGAEADRLLAPGITRVEGDVTVPASLTACVAGMDAVVHAAGVKQAARAATYHRINAEGTAHLALAARAAGVKRFVLVSSLAAQGPSPAGQPHRGVGSEAPINEYGRSKLAAEQRLASIFLNDYVILRPCLIFGPGDPHLLLWAQMVRNRLVPVVADLEVSFMHVDDFAALVCAVLAHPAPPPGPFFVSDGQPITMGALIDQLERLVAQGPVVRLPVSSGRLAQWVPWVEAFARATGLGTLAARRLTEMAASGWACTFEAAASTFGFAPTQRLLAGLPATVAGYRALGLLGGPTAST
jgi:nucleoside-diphosphate-sugar epimerase